MTKVCFVACANGLGHARRLLHIAYSWRLHGLQVSLVVTEKQKLLLSDEWAALSGDESDRVFIVQSAIGLQGPEFEETSMSYSMATDQVVTQLRNADLVISDNSLWPLVYRKDTILMAHFLWVEYYQDLIIRGFKVSKRYKDFIDFEVGLSNEIINFASIDPFRIFELKQRESFISILLPRYNLKVPQVDSNSKNILVTVGRTGSYKLDIEKIHQNFPNFHITVGQTNNISGMNALPSFVIGRSGLGTIRDCAEYGVDFMPLETTDPELLSNIKVIMGLKNSVVRRASDFDIIEIDKMILGEFPSPENFLLRLH